jgi:chitooligosaccharide deacetylase
VAIALVIIGLLALAHTAPFPFLFDATAPQQVMWSAPRQPGSPTIYLTFDDGPNPTATPHLLDVLAREQARATFFLIERYVTEDTAPLVRRMFAEGHGVALHTDRRWLMLLTPSALESWVKRTADRVEQLTGRRPCRAFRPHAGWRSVTMLAGLAQAGYQLVGWGWNAWDWNWFKPRTSDSVVRRITNGASDGLIVVIHDGHHEEPMADRRYAIEAAAKLIPSLRGKGYALGSVCDVVGWDEGPARPSPNLDVD